ncbi:hypothetical protein G5I_13955 [Acromyrmex echinatior]|uniref:Uncharacterized protein n=1 Tax=Acromyrmex echinatior TaxID=103372 RepID=F4X6D7_ACREC|nr:hypothetical protein G5I_13955 [Acromyrmex echinatior]
MSPFRGCEETQSESEDKDADELQRRRQRQRQRQRRRRGLLQRSFNTQVAGDPQARREDVVDINLVKQEVPGGARAYYITRNVKLDDSNDGDEEDENEDEDDEDDKNDYDDG